MVLILFRFEHYFTSKYLAALNVVRIVFNACVTFVNYVVSVEAPCDQTIDLFELICYFSL